MYPTYSKCWARIHQVTGIAEDGTLADWYDWMRRLGRYRERAAGSVGAFESEGEVIIDSCINNAIDRSKKGQIGLQDAGA